jgi:hypothetical protein
VTVDAIKALSQLDRPGVMAVMHAATNAEARTALAQFRDQLVAKGLTAPQAAARARRLDLARATLGGAFRTEAAFFAGLGAASTKGLSPKLAAWVTESACCNLSTPDPTLPTRPHALHCSQGRRGGRNRAVISNASGQGAGAGRSVLFAHAASQPRPGSHRMVRAVTISRRTSTDRCRRKAAPSQSGARSTILPV